MQVASLAITELLDNFVGAFSFGSRWGDDDGEHLTIGTTVSRSDLSNDGITV